MRPGAECQVHNSRAIPRKEPGAQRPSLQQQTVRIAVHRNIPRAAIMQAGIQRRPARAIHLRIPDRARHTSRVTTAVHRGAAAAVPISQVHRAPRIPEGAHPRTVPALLLARAVPTGLHPRVLTGLPVRPGPLPATVLPVRPGPLPATGLPDRVTVHPVLHPGLPVPSAVHPVPPDPRAVPGHPAEDARS
jgi:hypothetical protein